MQRTAVNHATHGIEPFRTMKSFKCSANYPAWTLGSMTVRNGGEGPKTLGIVPWTSSPRFGGFASK
jgi:hypothetical protein